MWAIFLRPIAPIPFLLVVACGRIAVVRWMRDGKLKRVLLKRID